ncbi:hypothetical protein KAW50_04600 [candidate division WOR-3 bacterium]|nr:hypothetical protein [candidate division WOR-3 bacterium]
MSGNQRSDVRCQMSGVFCLLFSVFCLLFSVNASAYFSGRAEGLGRSYSAIATGFDAVFWNPANIAISPNFSFNIATLGVEYNSNLTTSEYMKLYNKEHFNDNDKEMFANGEKLNVMGSAQAFSFSFKNFAVATYAYSNNKFNLPKDVTDLYFWGNEIDRTYSLEDIEGKSETGLAVALSFARKLERSGSFAIGGTIKYLHGISYLDVYDSRGSLTTTFYSTEKTEIYGQGSLASRLAQGGYGIAADFGLIHLTESYNFSVSVINLFSAMTWHKNATKINADFTLDSIDFEHFDWDLPWNESTTEGPFVTHLDPIFRLGGAFKRKLLLITSEVGYPQLFSIGIEFPSLTHIDFSPPEIKYPSHIVVFRGGMTFVDSRVWFGCGIGVGIKPINIDIGIRMSSLSHISGALSISVVPRD